MAEQAVIKTSARANRLLTELSTLSSDRKYILLERALENEIQRLKNPSAPVEESSEPAPCADRLHLLLVDRFEAKLAQSAPSYGPSETETFHEEQSRVARKEREFFERLNQKS